MKQIVIVGAGVSGLVAAIHCNSLKSVRSFVFNEIRFDKLD